MATTVGDFFVERLYEWGVRQIFGYPGDGINGVLGSLNRAERKIKFIQVRHEEMAAFMASAYAKFTGELGVCLSTGGPGASHLITGLYDAKLDHMPTLAITGQAPRTARGAHYQQELNLDRMFADVADYVQEAEAPAQVRHMVDRGIRIATARNGVAVLILPGDLQNLPYEDPPHHHGAVLSGIGYRKPRVVPYEADLLRAAEVLNNGKKIAILVGAGALGASEEVIAVADRLGAGVAKALLGKAVVPDDLPWVTGAIGYLGTEPSYYMMMECDTLLMIGSGFPYTEFLPKEGDARGVQIDIDPGMLSVRYPAEVNLQGDAAETLRALLPLLEQKTETSWRRRIAKHVDDWWTTMENRAMQPAHPDRPVIALVGDGVMQMNNMAELITVSKYWKQWSNPQWIVCVFNNEDLNQVTWEQRVMEGDPKFDATQQLPNVPYHKFGELIGMKGIFCDQTDRVGAAWEEALASERPVVLEFKTDPEVPPLPSHITLEEAKKFTTTVLKGDPREKGMIFGAVRQILSGLLPKDKE